jgi:hypothetical protein
MGYALPVLFEAISKARMDDVVIKCQKVGGDFE